MEGQLSIMDWMPEAYPAYKQESGYWDEDIRFISGWINDWITRSGFTKRKEGFSVWNHVPHLGYRLEIWTEKLEAFNPDTWEEFTLFEKAVKKMRKIEISTNITPSGIMISTLFLDGRRTRKQ